MEINQPTYNQDGLTYSKFKRLIRGLETTLSVQELSDLRPVVKRALAEGAYGKDEKTGSITDLTVSIIQPS